jgi:hypothetical protein
VVTRRLLAACAGLSLLAFAVIGTRHEAQVAHFLDRGGHAHHAAKLAGRHRTTMPDVHSADRDSDTGACAIATALHQAASPTVARPHVAFVPGLTTATSHLSAAGERSLALLYRLAPKTSPPPAA